MRVLLALLLATALLAAFGCSKPASMSIAPGVGMLRVRLTDAPGTFDAVNLVVTEISVQVEVGDSLEEWRALPLDSTQSFNLLALRNGVFANLAQGLIPAGHYTQIRLRLGAGSNVVVDGTTYPLIVPSGMESGYKLIGDFTVPAGGTTDLALDFDAARSIVHTGSGKYLLKPTCRIVPLATSGAVDGHAVPDSVATWVYALQGADTVATTLTSAGSFTLTPLAAGSYTVTLHPGGAWRDTSFSGVTVTAGQTTHLGDIALTPQ